MIYLDNAATTFPKPKEVYDALDFAQRNLSFNAGRGTYAKSIECLRILDELRSEIAALCDAKSDDVTLLSSATEALNIIINGLNYKDGANIYITPFEHNAIIRPLFNIKKSLNINIHILPFDKKTWEPDLIKIKNMFALNTPSVVFASQISNVTGFVVDYTQIFKMAKQLNSINVLDSCQALGILKPDTLNTDFVVFAGHKSLNGPFGIGGFVNLSNIKLKITKSGGTGSNTLDHNMPEYGHERYESGSPNVPAAYGTLAGIHWLKRKHVEKREKELTIYLIKALRTVKKVTIFAPNNTERLFGIVSIAVDGYFAEEVGDILSSEFDICVRTGYHCAPFIHEFINSTIYRGTVRISLSSFISEQDIDNLILALNTF